MERTFTVMMLSLSLWILVLGSVQGDITFSITSQSNDPSYCVWHEEALVEVTCTITPSTTTSVTLIKDSTTYSDCDNTQNDCLPPVSGSVPRYSFTSDYTKNKFTFQIADVTIGTDNGTYTCTEGGTSGSTEVNVCDRPETITITETGTEPVYTVSASTDCVFPDTDVTFEWFYVPVSSSEEYALNVTTTRSSEVAACSDGAKHVISSFEHTNAVENELEVFFRYKASHPSIAAPVVKDTARTYLIVEPKCCSCCCCCICCFIVLIVCVALGLVFCGGHIGLTLTDHEYSVKKTGFKDYGIKVVIPECCICVVVIIIQIIVYFAALKRDCIEDCDDDCCGVVVCLVVTIIVSIVKNAIESGIIYFVVHFKGKNYTDQGGDQHPQDAKQLPQRPQRGDADKHKSGEPKSNTTKTDEAGSFVSGRDVKVDTGGSSSWRAQPRPLPGIKSEKNTRGLSANIDDSDTNPSYEKKRLTPIGQESQLGWEEKPDRSEDGKEKKKKRKSKEKEKDSNITESADL